MNKKEKVTSNFLWRLFERLGAQGVSFVVQIILARILVPEVYGTIALITVFTTILNVFIDSGFANALIQKKDADELDFSTVFYFNIVVCTILYMLMFLAAPYIAEFYNDISLTPVIRVLCVTLLISGVKNVQQAYVSKTLQFKRFFFATLAGTIGAAVVGVILAYCGFGVWALVAQQLFNTTVDTIVLWITVKWRPKKQFSLKRLKILFSYGWKLLVSGLIDRVYNELWQLVIGKKYTSEQLAYYNRGRQLPNLIVTNINSSMDSVLFPVMSEAQDCSSRVKAMTRKSIKVSTYVLAPLMMGLAVTANPLVKIILTDKWLPCVPFMQIFCISYIFQPIHTANLNAIKAMGRSEIFLKLEIFKKIVGILILFLSMQYGVLVMAYSTLLFNVVAQIINSWPNRKLLNYHYIDQIRDIIPSILLSIIMGICVYSVSYLNLNSYATLLIQIPLGMIIYILLSKVFKLDCYLYLIDTLKPYITKLTHR